MALARNDETDQIALRLARNGQHERHRAGIQYICKRNVQPELGLVRLHPIYRCLLEPPTTTETRNNIIELVRIVQYGQVHFGQVAHVRRGTDILKGQGWFHFLGIGSDFVLTWERSLDLYFDPYARNMGKLLYATSIISLNSFELVSKSWIFWGKKRKSTLSFSKVWKLLHMPTYLS